MPASRILRLARTSRCAIVGSGTRKARAISAVVEAAQRAQRQRHLRLGRERRVAAGEDQLQSFVGESSVASISSSRRLAAASSSRVFAASVRSRRMRSIARLRAVVSSQLPGCSGHAVARPALGGDREGLLGGFLGEVEVAEEADQARRARGPTARGRRARGSLPLHQRAHLDRAAESRPPGSARRARSPRRGRRPRGGSSRRAPPWSRRRGRRWSASGRPRRAPWSPSRAAASARRG